MSANIPINRERDRRDDRERGGRGGRGRGGREREGRKHEDKDWGRGGDWNWGIGDWGNFGPGRGFRHPYHEVGEYGGGGVTPGGWHERPFGLRDDFSSNWFPDWDVYNSDNAVIVIMEVPGIKKEDIKIDVVENRLVLQSKRNFDERLRDADYVYLREREFGFFKRRVKLPEGCDVSKITAKLNDGILTVMIPKGEGTPGVRVKIE
ncbi:hypothetical protein Glove_522g18 [Diversispora epigaea]|uniref:SHSP domain-containing protein n=1 Tax=Diversispora epigaea TaxID=1348612 RepID=A0A397GEG9_9GLOM|nr:hypothetical protein Glove_522g18 [Diversispora epigaea]